MDEVIRRLKCIPRWDTDGRLMRQAYEARQWVKKAANTKEQSLGSNNDLDRRASRSNGRQEDETVTIRSRSFDHAEIHSTQDMEASGKVGQVGVAMGHSEERELLRTIDREREELDGEYYRRPGANRRRQQKDRL
eukprot:4292625-Pyramimonas_sp.AAC.1